MSLNSNVFLLEILHSDQYVQTLMNDEILTKSCKGYHGILKIIVYFESSSRICQLAYVSSLYSRLWDELLANQSTNIQCVIHTAQDFDSLPTYLCPNLTKVCTYKPLELVNTWDQRIAMGLSSVTVTDSSSIINDFRTCMNENEVYFIDDNNSREIPSFNVVAVGGTFDRLHNGHRKLLTLSAALCKARLIVGVVSDGMLQTKKRCDLIGSFEHRKATVEQFLALLQVTVSMDIVELLDPYGPTLADPTVQAIVVSSETLSGACKINALRRERCLAPLVIVVSRRADSATMSSTFLRETEMHNS